TQRDHSEDDGAAERGDDGQTAPDAMQCRAGDEDDAEDEANGSDAARPDRGARQCRRLVPGGQPADLPVAASAAAAAAAAVAARAIPRGRAGRSVLRPLDQLLGLEERAVLVLGDELQADPAAGLVDLLDDHVEHVASLDHVLDVADPPRADV